MAKPRTRAGSGITLRKNSQEVPADNVADLDLIEGDGIVLGIVYDRAEKVARVTVTATGPSSDRHAAVTTADTTPAELNTKIVVDSPLTKVVENPGADERLRIAHGGSHLFSDIAGIITDAQHGSRGSGLHADSHDNTNDPTAGEKAALPGTSGAPGAANKYVTDEDPRNSDARTPTGAAGGDLGGTYPNPTVDDGADGSAIHDDTPGEIAAVTEKATPVNADKLLIEDSEDSDSKKMVQVGNLPGGGSGSSTYLGLTDTPPAYTGDALKTLRVNAGETAVEHYDPYADTHTWAALQTFNAGLQLAASQAIKDSGGTDRIKLSTSSPHVEVDDDLRAERIGIGSNPNAYSRVYCRPTETITGTQTVFDLTPTYTANNPNLTVNAFQGIAGLYAASGGIYNLRGLQFTVNSLCLGVTATFTNLDALWVTAQPIAILSTGIMTVNSMKGAKITLNATKTAGAGAPAITDTWAIEIDQNWLAANASLTNYHGIEQADVPMTPSGFDRLMEMGGVIGTTPNLRLEGKAPSNPGSSKGRSQLLLSFNENGSVNLRRVEWIDSGAAGGAGIPANQKLLVAV